MGSVEIVIILALVACFLVPPDVESKAIMKRSGENFSQMTEEPYYCANSTPCGWEVYRKFTREIIYFVKSPCECKNGTRCVRAKDDISISAYVHHCRLLGERDVYWPSASYSLQPISVSRT
ncbi:uncharacterized protein LOC118186780 isoform X2 [Stegodyphus dumicola]|uniref:uncharacterized protein LOC118186780 isoform X2 n=1 Tax=Stegodyphus dumicola TaxID=202533 RepID=UPI0015B099D4|nr:uncharacterized protein LOC118186780 isoform X2 [Stegodyphus dumicola]